MKTAQHKIVNRAPAVQKPAAARTVQRQSALKVSSPKDPAEKEAEATGKKIARMALPESSIAYTRSATGGVFRQIKTDEKEKKIQKSLQSPYLNRFASSGICRQMKPEKEEKKIQRKIEGQPNVSSNVAADIQNSASGGSPLPLSVRRFMEPRFQADFSDVRIHTGDRSAQLNRQLNAKAFTVSNQVFFGKDQFQPHTSEGKELIAHELTHTIQQGASVQRSEDVSVSQSGPVQVQRSIVSEALDYFADKANLIPGFRMFTIILGVNPVNMSSVDRSAANILRAIVEFLPGGGLITRALDNHGVFEKVGAWVEQQIKTLGLVGSSIRKAVTDFIGSLGVSDVFDLGGVWNRAKRIFTEPIDRIISFAKSLASGILKFIKEAIVRPLAKLAEGTAGYELLKGILGEDPITGDPVPFNADTIIGGFMKLIGQEEVWNNLKKANGVARATAWFKGAVAALLGFVRQIPALFIAALQSLEIADIVLLPSAFAKVARVFGGFLAQFTRWAGNAVWNLLEIIFDVVSPGAFGYVKRTGAALKSILKNPLPFVGNLIKAAKQGFLGFADNIAQHLKTGLINWLTGSLSGVYIPKSFALMEIAKFAFSVLGLTWAIIRQKLVKVVGETAVKAMETGFDIVVTLVTEGPAAAWDKIKEQLGNIKDMVIGGITDFVIDMVVKKAIPKLVAMFIPGAGFLSAILSIYDTIMVFVQKLSQIAQVVLGFVDSIVAIAGGAIGVAIKRIESILAGLLSLAISFLAGFAGLGNVASKIVGVFEKIRAPFAKATDWLVNWIVTMAKKLFAKAFGKDKKEERTQEEKKADLAKGIGEARKLLEDKKLTSEQVQKKLPAIKSKYRITIFELVTDAKNETKETSHVHGEIHSTPVKDDSGKVDRESENTPADLKVGVYIKFQGAIYKVKSVNQEYVLLSHAIHIKDEKKFIAKIFIEKFKNKEYPLATKEEIEAIEGEDPKWESKIKGKGQRTGTPGHAREMDIIANRYAKMKEVKFVYLDRSYRQITNNKGVSRREPDVAVEYQSGRIDVIEVRSKTDDPTDLRERNLEALKTLPESKRGSVSIHEIPDFDYATGKKKV